MNAGSADVQREAAGDSTEEPTSSGGGQPGRTPADPDGSPPDPDGQELLGPPPQDGSEPGQELAAGEG